jgi:predicted CopG family antitoxin
MAGKVIKLSEVTYQRLLKLRRGKESMDRLVSRLLDLLEDLRLGGTEHEF